MQERRQRIRPELDSGSVVVIEPAARAPVRARIDRPAAPAVEPTVLIPRPEKPLPKGLRRCPTLSGAVQPMVRQTIDAGTCEGRQCDGYHKCGQCVYQEQPQYLGAELPPLENSPSRAAAARLERR